MLLKERRGEVSPEAEVPEEGALWGWGKAGLQHRVTASPVDGGPALHIVTAAPHQVAGAALDPRRGTDPESGPGRLSAHASLVPSCRSKEQDQNHTWCWGCCSCSQTSLPASIRSGLCWSWQGTVTPTQRAGNPGLILAVTRRVRCALRTCYSQQFFLLQMSLIAFTALTQHTLHQFLSSWEGKFHLLASLICSR